MLTKRELSQHEEIKELWKVCRSTFTSYQERAQVPPWYLLWPLCVTSSNLNIKQQIYQMYILGMVPKRLQSNQLILFFILFFRLDHLHHLEVVFFQMSNPFMRRGPAENCPTVRRHLHRFALSGCSEGGRADKPLTAL